MSEGMFFPVATHTSLGNMGVHNLKYADLLT